jgi:hypothetical protein
MNDTTASKSSYRVVGMFLARPGDPCWMPASPEIPEAPRCATCGTPVRAELKSLKK